MSGGSEGCVERQDGLQQDETSRPSMQAGRGSIASGSATRKGGTASPSIRAD